MSDPDATRSGSGARPDGGVGSDPTGTSSGSALPDGGVEGADADTDAEATPSYDHRTTVISRTVVRVVVPVIIVTSVALLLQGHNLPGGGFIGAVLTATAFVLVYVIFGLGYLRTDVLDIDADDRGGVVEGYRWLFAVGLALAAGTGLVPVLLGLPFLSHAVAFVHHVPLYGELEVASAFAFDLGVYFAVVGALLTVIGEVGAE